MAEEDQMSISDTSDMEAMKNLNPEEFKQTLILNEEGLEKCLKRLSALWSHKMGKKIAWSERNTLIATDKVEQLNAANINDDTLREVQFYNIAKENVEKGLALCEKEGIALDRPQDFMAEMLKSDQVMGKIRSGLVKHQVRIQDYEEKKQNKSQRKMIKQKKSQKQTDAHKEKKRNVEAIDKWKKELKRKGDSAPDLNKFIEGSRVKKTKKMIFLKIWVFDIFL